MRAALRIVTSAFAAVGGALRRNLGVGPATAAAQEVDLTMSGGDSSMSDTTFCTFCMRRYPREHLFARNHDQPRICRKCVGLAVNLFLHPDEPRMTKAEMRALFEKILRDLDKDSPDCGG